jgi:hypothetical protein
LVSYTLSLAKREYWDRKSIEQVTDNIFYNNARNMVTDCINILPSFQKTN